MAHVELADKLLELGVLLHAEAERAHRAHRLVKAHELFIGEMLDGSEHGLRGGRGRRGLSRGRLRLFGRRRAGGNGLLPRGIRGSRRGSSACSRVAFGLTGVDRRTRSREMFHAQHTRSALAHHVLRDHIGHVLKLVARQPELLELGEGQLLKLVCAGSHLVAGQVRLHALEHVFGDAALLQSARQTPCALQAGNGGFGGHGALGCLAALERRQVQMQRQHKVSLLSSLFSAVQVSGNGAGRLIASAGHIVRIVIQHRPNLLQVSK